VNGAGTGEDEQARVAAVEDGGNIGASVEDGGRGGFGGGEIFFKKNRREDDFRPLDAEVFNLWGHGSFPCGIRGVVHPGPGEGAVSADEIDTCSFDFIG
jgi:hypothetical protein